MGNDQKRALVAVVLSGIILFGWQYFFAPKANFPAKDAKTVTSEPTKKIEANSTLKEPSKNSEDSKRDLIPQNFTLSNQVSSYTLNNYLTVVDGTFVESNSSLARYFPGNHELQFLVNDEYKKLFFKVTRIKENEYEVKGENGIEGLLTLDSKGFLNFKLKSNTPFKYRFYFNESEHKGEESSFPMASSGQNAKKFVYFTKDFNSTKVDSDEKGDAEFKWAGVDFNYHLLADVFDEKTPFIYKTTENGVFTLATAKGTNELNFKKIFVRKDYDYLKKLGSNLHQAVDFGIWSLIAVPILHGLQFFYSVFPNYGISIIFLTIIIRLLTFPLQYKSFKSMKKMQEIQPELNKVREKFKNDPQKMQQETMALFRKAGANPLGGCLPLLLQMPIFFAFYRVLYSAVELVDAPFMLWIKDLSVKDPYYVLPVLMGLAMILHQKFTPTATTDPIQKKVMLFMPLIFAVFMKDFPAGLTLYIFVSTMIAMLQQLFVFKRK